MSRVVQNDYRSTVVPYSVPVRVQQPYIYCPVCHVEYPQSQTETHILKHTIQPSKIPVKKEEQPPVSTNRSKNMFMYPMIQPLEFSTTDLIQVSRRDTFKLDIKQKNKKVPKVIVMEDKQTQTYNRPLLQYRSNETDFYNCFDSFFNGNKFSSEDVTTHNLIIASKRQLNEWQKERVKK